MTLKNAGQKIFLSLCAICCMQARLPHTLAEQL
jgi:hypothetical protein